MKHCFPTGRRNYGRPLKRLHIHENETGQQVAQLHDRYMMMMMVIKSGWMRWMGYEALRREM
jgi:hypothetical protein